MKRKTGNRMLTTGLVLAMTAGMFAGCGNSAPAAATDNASADTETLAETSETAAVQETAKTDNGEVPTLIWWTVGGTPADDFDQAISEISDYAEEKIGVRIDVKIAGWADYDTKMNNIVNTGEYFDLMFVNNTNYSKFVNLNALENITDLVQSETPDLYGFIPQELWDGVKIHNNVYAVPTYKDSSMTQFWMLDDTYVQKYNIDVEGIKDFATLNDALQTIKEGEGKSVYPMKLAQGSTFNGFFNGYDDLAGGVSAIGVWYEDEERKVVSLLEQDDVKEKLNWLHKWYQDGIINPDANVVTDGGKQSIFGSAQGWPAAATTWAFNNGIDKYDLTQVFGPMYATGTIQGSMNAISANSKYKAEALKVLELMNTDSKFRDMCAYGTEGNYMKYSEDGTVQKLRDDWNWPSYTQGTFFILSTQTDGDPDAWEQVKKQNETAVSSTCLGFALDITDIQNEVANCNMVWDKYKNDMLTGASDPETAVPACIEELKAAGLDKVIEEAQRQIDEFFCQINSIRLYKSDNAQHDRLSRHKIRRAYYI
ncbi:MAG: ABC transporter substrate-binding protein [Gallintestinimicrobium sp.]